MTPAPVRFKFHSQLLIVLALTLQWVVLHGILRVPLGPVWETLLPGLAIFGAATLLSWAAELAQLEISQALALAFLALVAVLPEYAVDMYLAWKAAKEPAYVSFAAANMTGANRLLIGMGWSAVLFAYWVISRKRVIHVKPQQRLELFTLLAATVYAFLLPLKRTLSLWDTAIFLSLFAWYIVKAGRGGHAEQPGLAGPAEQIALLPRAWRRAATVALFVVPAIAIFLAAEPFANGLLHHARALGIEEFLLIQWLAPLASESPEFIVAILFAVRNNPTAGLGTLISSKVNQWTLLVGMLPLVYAISGQHLHPMPLDARQAEELLLTSAQSLLAIVILANLHFGLGEAWVLFALFAVQFFIPSTAFRWWLSAAYLVLVAGYLVNPTVRRAMMDLLRRRPSADS